MRGNKSPALPAFTPQSGGELNPRRLKEINNAIKWLNKINELKLKNIEKYEIIELPDMNTGYSFYRIMNDCETDNVNEWIELKKGNRSVEASMGDILIISKP
jgi:hypothetical protein